MTSTPAAASVVMDARSGANPSSPAWDKFKPAVLSVLEPGTYTLEGVTKDTKRRLMGSVAACDASSAILLRPWGPLISTLTRDAGAE